METAEFDAMVHSIMPTVCKQYESGGDESKKEDKSHSLITNKD